MNARLLAAEQLGVATGEGLSLPRALRIAAATCRDRNLAAQLEAGAGVAESGASAATALTRSGLPLPLILLVKEVEEGPSPSNATALLGTLAETPLRLRRFWASMWVGTTYPLISLILALGGAGFILTSVLPDVHAWQHAVGIHEHFPATTMLSGLLVAMVPVTLALVVMTLGWWPRASLAWRARLCAPLVMARRAAHGDNLGALIDAGVSPERALALLATLESDRVWRGAFALASEKVKAGAGLAESLLQAGLLSNAWHGPVSLGTERGHLAQTLRGVARVLHVEAEGAARRFRAITVGLLSLLAGTAVLLCALTIFGGIL
ncbi:MAG: type II secretion system F family protein [Deltaproteobacteria bacterium]|nr:type II secretion system F family protein [Deltaproteobacteria bacterium]